jgi:hypothetical protein
MRREAAVGLVDVGTDVGRALDDVGRVVAGLLEVARAEVTLRSSGRPDRELPGLTRCVHRRKIVSISGCWSSAARPSCWMVTWSVMAR